MLKTTMMKKKTVTNELILSKLADIERKYDVRVLLAVESGSRAWGFASPDSDYDVRFIYVHKKDWYLSLYPGRDVIEEMDIEKELDFAGWDLRKALTLMAKGNAMFVEWLSSPICYFKDEPFYDEIASLKDEYFKKVHCVNHYYHMAVNHDERYLERLGCELKRFMYYSRGLLAAKWALDYGSYPPVPYMQLVEAEVNDECVREGLQELVRLKSQSKEHDREIVDESILSWFASLQQYLKERLSGLDNEEIPGIEQLDQFFLRTICQTNEDIQRKDIKTLSHEEMLDELFGKHGTPERDKFEDDMNRFLEEQRRLADEMKGIPVTTKKDIEDLQGRLVQCCINFVNERGLTDIYRVEFNADELFESAKSGEWMPCTDSYLGVEGLKGENGVIVTYKIGESM